MSNIDFVIAHHGIKGQKKGVRNYRNYDGTLTPEGKERYYGDKSDSSKTKTAGKSKTKEDYKVNQKTDSKTKTDVKPKTEIKSKNDNQSKKVDVKPNNDNQNKKDSNKPKSNLNLQSKALRESSKMMDEAAKAIPHKPGQYVKQDYSNLPNAELEKRIRRLELEDRYGKLSGDTKYIKSGSEKAKDLLHTVGSVLAVAATAVGIASLVQQMKMNSAQNEKNKSKK